MIGSSILSGTAGAGPDARSYGTGGNALLRRGEPLDVEVQRRNLSRAVTRAIAPVARRHQVVITHGNGPQIGLLALQAAAYKDVKPYPLDVLGHEGMIGYLIGQSLANELPGREIATLLLKSKSTHPIRPSTGQPSQSGRCMTKRKPKCSRRAPAVPWFATVTASGVQYLRRTHAIFTRSARSGFWFVPEPWSFALGVGEFRS